MCPLNITFAWGVVPGNLGGLLVTHTLEQCVPKKANFWLNMCLIVRFTLLLSIFHLLWGVGYGQGVPCLGEFYFVSENNEHLTNNHDNKEFII